MRDILHNLESKIKILKEKILFALEVYLNKINESIGESLSHLGEVGALAMTETILEKVRYF